MKKFRKFISLLLTVIFLLSASPLISADVFAETITGTAGDSITWTYDDETNILSITGSGAMPDYSRNTLAPWYSYSSTVTEIVVGEGITHIGNYCFDGYSLVVSVTLPETLIDIGVRSFANCTVLSEVNFPDSIISIGSSAFSNCSNLSDFSFPSSLKTIGNRAFYYTAIAEVEIPLTLESLGSEVFCNPSLEKFVSGSNIKNVNLGNCSSLKELRFADDITSFSATEYPFEELIIPGTVKYFSLSNAVVVGYGSNPKLKRLILSEGITSIPKRRIDELQNLERLYLPKSVVNIESGAIDPSNTVYCYENTVAYFYAVENGNPIVSLGRVDTDYSELIAQLDRYDDYDFSQYSQASVEHLTASYIAAQAALISDSQAEVNAARDDLIFRYDHLFKFRGVVTGNYLKSNPKCHWLVDADKGLLIIEGRLPSTMDVYTGTAPWRKYKGVIYDMIITDGSVLGNYGFYQGSGLKPVVETVTCYGTVTFAHTDINMNPFVGMNSNNYTIYCTKESTSVIQFANNLNKPYVIIDSNLNPKVSIADYSSCSFNDIGRTIDGLSPMMTGEQVLADGVGGNGYTAQIETSSNYVGTGSTVILKSEDTGKVLDEYAFVLYGDLNGDGVYDGQDATMAAAVSGKMLTEDKIGTPAILAAECNHDGAVDDMEIAVLQQAGVLLAQIDQSKSGGELTTDSAYQDYVSLIDQTPDAQEDVTVEEPADEPSEQAETGFNILSFLEALMTRLVTYIKTLLSILK